MQIKLWIRTKEWIEYAEWKEFNDFLEAYGGIGIFRDGLSILPAQKASEVDWLKLTNRHIKKGTHISYYQMWGSVDLVQENTVQLIDRTSREGLLETVPFTDLSNLVRVIVFNFEQYVGDIRNRYNRLLRGDRPSTAVLNKRAEAASIVLQKFSKQYDFQEDPWNIKETIDSTEEPKKIFDTLSPTMDLLRREVESLQEQSNALLEAAGFGIAIAVAIHELEKITSNLFYGLDRAMKTATSLTREEYKQLDRLSFSAQSLLNELKRIAPLRVTRLEQKRRFKIRDAILAGSGAFRLAWEDDKILFLPPSKQADFEIYGSFGACSQIFANLFDNSTYWVNVTASKERRIIVQVDPEMRKVIIADTGPGVDSKIKFHLFEPFFSLKNPPSGLGLYICKYYAGQLRAFIREAVDSEKIPGFSGAHFTVIFKEENS